MAARRKLRQERVQAARRDAERRAGRLADRRRIEAIRERQLERRRARLAKRDALREILASEGPSALDALVVIG